MQKKEKVKGEETFKEGEKRMGEAKEERERRGIDKLHEVSLLSGCVTQKYAFIGNQSVQGIGSATKFRFSVLFQKLSLLSFHPLSNE